MAVVRWTLIAALMLVAAAGVAMAEDGKSAAADKKALAAAQAFVGSWRGVGQPKRGSNQGAWTEEFDWAWRFEKGRAELVAEQPRDKFYTRLELQPGDEPGRFVLLATPVKNGDQPPSPERFTGSRGDDALVFVADEPRGDAPARITLRLVAGGDRMLVLYEKRQGEAAYGRLAEVGATRKGSSFAKSAASGPECVVTGGLGTIAVMYEGKKYYVCCTGCRDLFQEDPAGVLAEYRERKAAEAAEKQKSGK